jgi:hypothetical protein
MCVSAGSMLRVIVPVSAPVRSRYCAGHRLVDVSGAPPVESITVRAVAQRLPWPPPPLRSRMVLPDPDELLPEPGDVWIGL